MRDATVRLLVFEQPPADPTQGVAAGPAHPTPGAISPRVVDAVGLIERLTEWAAPVDGKLLGSFTCTMSLVVCNLIAHQRKAKHADEHRLCQESVPLGFVYRVTTGTAAAREALVGMLAESRHPFQPDPLDDERDGMPLAEAGSLVLQGPPTLVLLFVAGLFEAADASPEEEYTRAGARKSLRAEHF